MTNRLRIECAPDEFCSVCGAKPEEQHKDGCQADPDEKCFTCGGIGWGVFLASEERGIEIERCDECDKFADDKEATRHVLWKLMGKEQEIEAMPTHPEAPDELPQPQMVGMRICEKCDGNTYVGQLGVDAVRCPICDGKGLVTS